MKLWLDDLRPAPEGWEHCVSAWKALELVLRMGEEIDEWSLDHDLGEGVPTGNEFLRMIELMLALGMEIHVPEVVHVHSANPPGAKAMNQALVSIEQLRW